MESFIKLIKWEGDSTKHFHVLYYVVGIITNMTIYNESLFSRTNGLTIVAQRLQVCLRIYAIIWRALLLIYFKYIIFVLYCLARSGCLSSDDALCD